MKTYIIIILLSALLSGQDFTVKSISGNVWVLKGTAETWLKVSKDEQLNTMDVILTEPDSEIQLSRDGNFFRLKADAALGLNHIRKLTLDELVLILAMEEIKKVKDNNNNGNVKNTAVYGTEEGKNKIVIPEDKIGKKKINGALYLAQHGYKKSSIAVYKEVLRKHPVTRYNIEERLYFIDLLFELKLYNEAIAELTDLRSMKLSASMLKTINSKLDSAGTLISE